MVALWLRLGSKVEVVVVVVVEGTVEASPPRRCALRTLHGGKRN